jgi:transcriptional regulator with XRE-family HTH domain
MDHDDERSPGRLGPLLRAHRVAAGLTQDQLASHAGVSTGALRDIEQGRTLRPRAASVSQLAEALQLSGRQREELAASAAGPGIADGAAGQERPVDQGGDVPDGLRLDILGPFAAWREMTPLALGPARQRAVLALLVLHEGTGLSRAAVIDALWRQEPPPAAVEMVQGNVGRLRRLLWPGSATGPGIPQFRRAALAWDGACYRLSAGAVHSDLAVFMCRPETRSHR